MQKKVLISLLGSALLVFGCDDGSAGTSDGNTGNSTDPSGGSSGDDTSDPTTDPSAGSNSDSDSNTTDPTAGSDTDDTGDSDTDDTSDTSDTGIGFISDPDGGGVSIECSIWDQDCGEGEKCAPWANDGGSSWNATKCVALDANPGQPGDECTVEGSGVSGVDTCDVSSMCWDVDPETNMGNCVAFCTGSENAPTCDDPDTSCSIANDGVLVLCLPTCDPLLIGGCPDGQACYPIDDSFVCAPDASGEDQGADNDPCEFINACDAGTICVNADIVDGCPAGSGGCCQFVCDLTDDPTAAGCTDAESCEPWYEEGAVPPGYEDVGVCALPA